MAATPHRCQHLAGHGEADRFKHVGGARAARDQGGPLVDYRVPDAPGRVVAGIGSCQDRAAHARAQTSDGRRIERALRAGQGRDFEVHGDLFLSRLARLLGSLLTSCKVMSFASGIGR